MVLFLNLKTIFQICSGDGTIYVDENINAFSNSYNKIGANINDVCMNPFVNTLEGREMTYFFNFPPKYFSNWDELCYWFRSTYGQQQNAIEFLKEYNSMVYQPSEMMRAFNLRFTKLYNRISESIRPYEHDSLIHYYNIIPLVYNNRLEEKVVNSIFTTLQSCVEYEDQMQRICLPIPETSKIIEMTVVLKLMKYIDNRLISFQRRVSPTVMNPIPPPNSSIMDLDITFGLEPPSMMQ